MALISGPMYDFQLITNEDDLSGMKVLNILGEPTEVHKMEAFLLSCKYQHCQFQLALNHDECVGFLMYHLIADCVLFIRGIYVYPEFEGKGLAKGLVNSLKKPVKKIIYQTRKNNPPVQLFEQTKKFNRNKIYETDNLITWEFDWRES